VGSDGDPSITIEIDYDLTLATLTGSGGSGVWPDIIIAGDVLNLRGDVLIDNNSQYGSSRGDVVIEEGVEVNAKTLTILSGGTVSIGGGDNDIIYHNAGDPYSKWKTPALTGDINNDLVAGTLNAERFRLSDPTGQAAIDAFLAVQPTTPSLEARRIFIDTAVVNINGIIKSGQDDFHVTLDSSVRTQIENLRNSGTSEITRLNTNNDDFQIYYDPTGNGGNGKVIVTELRPSGGFIDITGQVMNTRNGKIIVYGGHPDIDIINQMGFSAADAPELVLQRIDATTRGDGQLIIKDTAKPEFGGLPHTTIYTVGDDGVVARSVNGTSTDLAGKTDTYNPQAGYRYGWTLAQANRTELIEEWTEGDWLGIDAFVPDSRAPDKTDVTSFPGVLLPDSNYFYLDASKDGDTYTYNSVAINDFGPERKRTGYDSWSTWYGSNYTWFQYTTITETSTYHTHTIEADRPIGIEFIGHDVGSILVNAGNSNVVVDGKIDNAYGDTTIITTGTLRTTSGGVQGEIGGRTIDISAAAGIGIDLDPVRVNLSDADGVTGQRLDAAASAGSVHLRETFGDMVVGQITAGGSRDVVLTSHSDLLRASGAAQGDGRQDHADRGRRRYRQRGIAHLHRHRHPRPGRAEGLCRGGRRACLRGGGRPAPVRDHRRGRRHGPGTGGQSARR
jgi:hypothetical protein